MALDLLKRAEKGSSLTEGEHDTNFSSIETEVNGKAALSHTHVPSADLAVIGGTPSAGTFLRGDDRWETPPGGGDMLKATYDPDEDGQIAAAVIAAGAVTYAKIQDFTAASRLLGRGSAGGAGDPEELTVGGGIEISTLALQVADNGITYAKLQDVTAASRLLGRGSAGGAGDPEELTAGSGLEISTTTLQVADNGITYAKLQDISAASRLLGRGSAAGAGDAQELTLTGGLEISTTAVQIADDGVTLAKIQTLTADRVLGSDGSGNPSEITAGSGITISAGVISATGAASASAVSLEVWNQSGVQINAGDPVYQTGYNGTEGKPTVARAASASGATMPAIGIATTNIATGAGGTIVEIGEVGSLNTSSFSAGDEVYVGTTGGLTSTPPTGANLVQQIGVVLRADAASGRISVSAQQPNTLPNLLQDRIWRGSTGNQPESVAIADEALIGRTGAGRIVSIAHAGLTEESAPADADFLVGFELGGGALRKFGLGTLRGGETVVTFASPTTSWDCDAAPSGLLTATGDTTVSASNFVAGRRYRLRITASGADVSVDFDTMFGVISEVGIRDGETYLMEFDATGSSLLVVDDHKKGGRLGSQKALRSTDTFPYSFTVVRFGGRGPVLMEFDSTNEAGLNKQVVFANAECRQNLEVTIRNESSTNKIVRREDPLNLGSYFDTTLQPNKQMTIVGAEDAHNPARTTAAYWTQHLRPAATAEQGGTADSALQPGFNLGSGNAVFTPLRLLGIDGSGNVSAIALGTAGQVLTSNGTGALPTMQAATGGAGTAFNWQDDPGDYTVTAFVPGTDGAAKNELTNFTAAGTQLVDFSADTGEDGYGAFRAATGVTLSLSASGGISFVNGAGPFTVLAGGIVSWLRVSATSILLDGDIDEAKSFPGGIVSTDLSDASNTYRAASDTVVGAAELATAAETTTGTDATRAVTPDGLAGSVYGKEVIGVLVFDDSEDVATGDGAGDVFFRIPSKINGWNLVEVAACHQTAGTGTGTDVTTIQIHNVTQAADMLITNLLTIDEDETDSSTAATAATIDTNNDDVATGDQLRIDVDGVTPTTAPKGLYVELTFRAP